VKTHWTSSADDPKQARAVGASWADAINAILTHLGLSTITSTPATVGDGLEINSSALRVKLNGSTLVRSGSGMSVNVGTGNNQIVRLDGSSKLPAVDGSALTGVLPVGSVSMFAGSSAPTGWLLCNGAAVSRTTFSALFAIIGTTYGAGNGSTTFNVPDMRGRAAIGVGQGSGLTDRAPAVRRRSAAPPCRLTRIASRPPPALMAAISTSCSFARVPPLAQPRKAFARTALAATTTVSPARRVRTRIL
jgi:microcystin-dependent protein